VNEPGGEGDTVTVIPLAEAPAVSLTSAVPDPTLAVIAGDPDPIDRLADALQPGDSVREARAEDVGVEGRVGLYVAILPVGGGDTDATLAEPDADAVDEAVVPVDDTDGVTLPARLPLPDPLTDAVVDASPDRLIVCDELRVHIEPVETPDAVSAKLEDTVPVVVLEELTHVLPEREELGLPDTVRILPVLEGDGDALTVRQVPVTVSVRD